MCQCPLSGLLISTLDSHKPHSIRAAKAKIARVFQTVIFFVTICRFFCFFEIEVFFVTHLMFFSPLFLFYHSYSVMPTIFLEQKQKQPVFLNAETTHQIQTALQSLLSAISIFLSPLIKSMPSNYLNQ